MKGIDPDALPYLNFDYYGRFINITVSIIGIFLNTFHLIILTRKSMRRNPVFIIFLVICIADLIQLLVILSSDIQYALEFNGSDFCLGYHSYLGAIHYLGVLYLAEIASMVSSWLTVLMAFFRTISIKFSMSSWSETLSKPSFANTLSASVFVFGFAYTCLSGYTKYTITPKIPGVWCPLTQYSVDTGLYNFDDGGPDGVKFVIIFTIFDSLMIILQLILFIFSTISLVRFIRETSAIKMLKNKNDRQKERTEGLILFTLVSFFIATFPLIVVNMTLAIVANMEQNVMFLMASTTIASMMQTLNSSSHGIICLLMSSQYRDVVKSTFNSGNDSTISVVPVENVSVVRVDRS